MPRLPMVASLPEGPYYGALAEFTTPHDLYAACEKVRDAGYTRWDAHTPFPVHGLDRAMGMRRSLMPFIVLGMALIGAAGGFALQYWVHSVEYPLTISGKPHFAWPAYVPITFELGILFGSLGAVFGMLGLNQLPMHWHPLFSVPPFEKATDDRFFISIESWDPKFEAERTRQFLQGLGAKRVDLVTSGEAG
jgi:ActD protein